jgi:hypothetical protein
VRVSRSSSKEERGVLHLALVSEGRIRNFRQRHRARDKQILFKK